MDPGARAGGDGGVGAKTPRHPPRRHRTLPRNTASMEKHRTSERAEGSTLRPGRLAREEVFGATRCPPALGPGLQCPPDAAGIPGSVGEIEQQQRLRGAVMVARNFGIELKFSFTHPREAAEGGVPRSSCRWRRQPPSGRIRPGRGTAAGWAAAAWGPGGHEDLQAGASSKPAAGPDDV